MNDYTPTAETAQDLRAAAAAVPLTGWTTGTYMDVSGRRCAVGILRLVAEYNYYRVVRAARAMQAVLPGLPGAYVDSMTNAVNMLITFNDHECKGGEELSELFTQAAEKVEANLS